jgi:predicted amidohydrolase YtcJ
MELYRLCYKLLKRIFATGLLIAVTVPHKSRKCYIIQRKGDERRPELSIQGQLRKYIADNKIDEGEIVIGWGYDDTNIEEMRHTFKEDLDAVSDKHPILLVHITSHLAACNSLMLSEAEITADTENPPGGVIQRIGGGEHGEPNGVLEEQALMKLTNSGALRRALPNRRWKCSKKG